MSSFITNSRVISPEPDNYQVPPFPSLYWPFPWEERQSRFLFHVYDIWLFTLYWTLICFAAVHMTAAAIAISVQWRNWKAIWITPVVFGFVGALEAVVGGSIVGGLLGAIYNAGYFRMSTWVPFVWALINSLVIILSSFAIQGGL